MQIDHIDKRILNTLGMNCRTSYQTLAEKLNLSSTAVQNRVNQLIERGVIVSFIVELNLAMIDADFMLALIASDGTQNEDDIVSYIGAHPNVSEVGALTGGEFILFGSYQSSEQLSELRRYLMKIEGTTSLEIHPMLFPRGKKTSLKHLHLKVLSELVKDARMPITTIAKNLGLAARTVSRAITELLESEAVRFSIRWNLNAADSITFLARIEWNESTSNIEDLLALLRHHYQEEFWEPLVAATSPVMFPAFVVQNLRDVERITRGFRDLQGVVSIKILLGKPSRSFMDIRRKKLEEMIQSVGR